MRLYSGRIGADSLNRLGTTIADAVTAWSAGWSEVLLSPGAVNWDYFVAQIRDGRGAILHGRESALPEEFRRSNWQDAHALYVNEILTDDSFWVVDPLGQQAAIFQPDVLKAYAQSLYGADIIICGLTRRTPQS